jgi:hypothetical protein
MTHAFNRYETEPLANGRTAAVDEGAAMAVTYAFTGSMSEDDYSERGIDPEKLEKCRKIFGELVDRQGSKKKSVDKTRKKSVEAIEILRRKNIKIEDAFRQLDS